MAAAKGRVAPVKKLKPSKISGPKRQADFKQTPWYALAATSIGAFINAEKSPRP